MNSALGENSKQPPSSSTVSAETSFDDDSNKEALNPYKILLEIIEKRIGYKNITCPSAKHYMPKHYLKPQFKNPYHALLQFPCLVLPFSTTRYQYWICKSISQDKPIKSIIMLYTDHNTLCG